MKTLRRFLFLALLAQAPFVSAQVVVDSPEYNQLKASGQLGNTQILQDPALSMPVMAPAPASPTLKANSCDCYVEPDGTYTLALAPNDDGSSAVIPIPFTFCLYGNTYNQIYVNNNGNLTFTGPMGTFSATAFPSSGPNAAIVAPFWGDVDTRPSPGNPGNTGQVLYKITPTAVYVNWEDVGYYSQHGDLKNTFQAIITDGVDPVIEGGNVAFCYGDMQWTTGDASQGQGGFGGVPATAGANKGDGVSYFLISRFDHPGTDFDGALGQPDGISWLDYKSFAFDACNVGNVPPIPDGISSCDTFRVCAVGDTAHFSIDFLSPESNQTTSITYNDGGLSALTEIANISGNTAHLVLEIVGDFATAGYYTVSVTATDDFAPIPGETTLSFVIHIDSSLVSNMNPILTPLEGCDSVELSVLNGPYDSYMWDDLTSGPTNWLNDAGDYGVTVSLNGCLKRVHSYINIMEPFNINLPGPFTYCPPLTSVEVTIPDSLYYSSITWGLADPGLDSLFSNELGAGTYTISLVDSAGLCSKDTTFTIFTQPQLILQPDDETCDLYYTFTTNTGGSGAGSWSVAGTPPAQPTFQSTTDLNTTVTFTDYGTYELVYTDDNCGVSDTVVIISEGPPPFNFTADFFICPGDLENLVVEDSASMSSIDWGVAGLNDQYDVHLGAGTYTATMLSAHGCQNDTTFTIATQPPVVIQPFATLCGDTIEFDFNTGPQTGMWTYYNSAGTVNFRDVTEFNTGLSIDTYGVYNLVFTEPTCNDADTLTVEFIPYLWVDVNDSIEFCYGQTIELPSNILYPEYVNNIIWNTGATTSSIFVSDPGYYSITVSNQCNAYTDSIYALGKLCDIELPNVFTPGDGNNLNDGWKLMTTDDIFKEFSCVITNRWGNIVYEFKDQYDVWLGKDMNGNDATEGVYFYIIRSVTLDDNELNKEGFIHLVRD